VSGVQRQQAAAEEDHRLRAIRVGDTVVDKAFEVVNALDDAQRQQAMLRSQGIDLVLGPNQPMRTVPPEGLEVSATNAQQPAMLMDLIGQYGGLLNDQTAPSPSRSWAR
jgi:hypothetical protein